MTAGRGRLAVQLAANSVPYRDPLAAIDWQALDGASFWLPEPALSLYGLPEYAALSLEARRALSREEFVHFARNGIWLERLFMQRLGGYLGRLAGRPDYEYLLHEIREEAGHSLMFLRVIEAGGGAADGWDVPRVPDFLGRHLPVDSLAFWIAVVLGEDIPDRLNRYVRRQTDPGVSAAVRAICTLHARDEARHVAYARRVLEDRLAAASPLVKRLHRPLAGLLFNRLVDTYCLPPPAVYHRAGLGDGRHWRRLAAGNPVHAAFVRSCVEPTLRLFAALDLPVRLEFGTVRDASGQGGGGASGS